MTGLHDQNPVGRFSDRVTDYVKYRPTYPAEALDAILDGLGPLDQLLAADVGAGTGISARLLGERVARVVAVEPGEDMRRAAHPHTNVDWVAGTAEATGLRSHAFDLVLCAQSFHWFRPNEALVEFARILKPGGRLAICWNRRRNDDPLTAGYRQATIDVGGESAAESADFDPAVIAHSGLFAPPALLRFQNAQRLDLDGLIGRARSASYVPKTGPAGERLLQLLRDLHHTHADDNGFVTMAYETEVYRSSRL